jgi:CRP-like cAMP-binding protein
VDRHYRRRQIIFHHGDPSDGMHLIVSGRVMIRISTPLGEEACLTVSGPGDSVGEQSLLLEGERRSASALALDPVETLFLSSSAFAALRREDMALDRVMIEVLTNRVLRLTNQLVEALFVPATTRVLRRVADAAALYGEGAIPLTQEEIASMAGCTRPTVNRALRSAEDAGMVDLARRRIRVLDVEGLRRLSD